FENAVSADVHFSKERNSFSVKIIVNEGVKGGGIDIKGDATNLDVYACFNEAADKVAKQLRRYKRKIKNHRREEGGLKSITMEEQTLEEDGLSISEEFANNNIKENKKSDLLTEEA